MTLLLPSGAWRAARTRNGCALSRVRTTLEGEKQKSAIHAGAGRDTKTILDSIGHWNYVIFNQDKTILQRRVRSEKREEDEAVGYLC